MDGRTNGTELKIEQRSIIPRKKAPEITFQDHIAAYLQQKHGYIRLEQSDITDSEHDIAEDHLWSFLTATQKTALDKPVI